MAKTKVVTTILTQDKKCKSCVRFSGPTGNPVTTSMYLQNAEFEAIDSPESIKVTVEKG